MMLKWKSKRRADFSVPTIVHVTTVDGSLYFLLRNQIHAIKKHGYRVFTISAPGPWADKLVGEGIPHLAVGFTRKSIAPIKDLIAFIQLIRIFKKNSFTIVHTHNPKPGFYGQIAAKIAGVPWIVNTVHGYMFHENTPYLKRKIFILMERIAALCSTKILSQNSEDFRTAVKEKICTREKIIHLGNGIDTNRFNPEKYNEKMRLKKRLELGIDSTAFVVGFVGRFVREKGILELFEAVKILKEKNIPVLLIMIGPQEKEKRDQISPSEVKKYGIEDLCRFLGFRMDMPEMYSIMDVFVLPSYREGFPRSAMEATAMKIPCVVSNIRGCREIVFPGENGYLVPTGDPEAIAEAIEEIFYDPVRRKRMGEKGREISLLRFDETNIFKKVISLYDDLITRKNDYKIVSVNQSNELAMTKQAAKREKDK